MSWKAYCSSDAPNVSLVCCLRPAQASRRVLKYTNTKCHDFRAARESRGLGRLRSSLPVGLVHSGSLPAVNLQSTSRAWSRAESLQIWTRRSGSWSGTELLGGQKSLPVRGWRAFCRWARRGQCLGMLASSWHGRMVCRPCQVASHSTRNEAFRAIRYISRSREVTFWIAVRPVRMPTLTPLLLHVRNWAFRVYI